MNIHSLYIIGFFTIFETFLLYFISSNVKLKIHQNTLKLIAIVAMTLDHVAVILIPYYKLSYIIFRIIGRITFPILIYIMVEGYKYTRSKLNYAIKLALFAVIAQVPFMLSFNTTELNAIFSILLGLIFLIIYKSNINKVIKVLLIILILRLSVFCSYGMIGIVLAFVFFINYKDKNMTAIWYSIVMIIELIINYIMFDKETIIIQLGLFLPLILLNLYNGKRKDKPLFKYSIYIYYPLHLLILYVIKGLI